MREGRELMRSSEAQQVVAFRPRTTLTKWAEKGPIPALRVDGRWRFRRRELEAWLAGRTPDADSQADLP